MHPSKKWCYDSDASDAHMVPIVIIHRGDSYYLADTIAQARKVRGGKKPILIGDQENRHYQGAHWVPYGDYFKEADSFARIYQHYNPSPHHYQWLLFCFQKWIFLKDFMEREGVSRAFVIDSDVLVYLRPDRVAKLYAEADFTVSDVDPAILSASGNATFINRLSALEELTALMFEMFGDTALHTRIRDFAEAGMRKSPPQAITEMTALALLRERFPNRVANTYAPKDGIAICHSVLCEQGFEMENGRKRLEWIEGVPHGRFLHGLDGPEWIPLAALHFQGSSRRYMAGAVAPLPFDLAWERLTGKATYRVFKEKRRFERILGRQRQA